MIAVLGSFDGFHRGHQVLFKKAMRMAEKNADSWCVVTFFPHPQSVIGKKPFPVLYTEPEKDILARCLGVPEIIRIPFSRSLAGMDPPSFVEMLEKNFFIRGIVVGEDFRFGKARTGDSFLLGRLAAARGWDVEILPHFSIDDQKISSRSIREKVISGDVGGAERDLGYPFSILGMVVHGDGRGRTIGFPTMNLDLPEGKIIPPKGVYSGSAMWKERSYPAAVNIGLNPTFPGKRDIRCEAHIPGFREELYGEWINLCFSRRIRRETKFESSAVLIERMKADIGECMADWNTMQYETRKFIDCMSLVFPGH